MRPISLPSAATRSIPGVCEAAVTGTAELSLIAEESAAWGTAIKEDGTSTGETAVGATKVDGDSTRRLVGSAELTGIVTEGVVAEGIPARGAVKTTGITPRARTVWAAVWNEPVPGAATMMTAVRK